MRTCFGRLLLALLVGLLGVACHPQGESEPPVDLVTPASSSGPLARRLAQEFQTHYQKAQGMTYQTLLDHHRPAYHKTLGFKVNAAAHYQGFVSAFGLSAQATQTLQTLGFVVVPPPSAGKGGAGPADVYYRVFAEDLPVFISADSILHAWHRSFDKILETTEQQDLYKTLTQLVSKTMAQLDPKAPADRDALFYLGVAKSLLDDSVPPAAVQSEVSTYLGLIKERKLAEVPFMGVDTFVDFSQFIPRGHYTHSEELKKYFLAMMWLGRTDLVLFDPDKTAEPRPREEAAARALARAMEQSGALPLFQTLDGFYRAFVGQTNAINPSGLLKLCSEAKLSDCVGDPKVIAPLYAKQPAPEYSSRVFAGDVPPITMRFFPQRFGYGAWVTSQTTTPRLKPAVQGGRAMAMPEDVAFVLGSDRAVEYFAQDMQQEYRENLPATLHAARKTIEAIKPTDLDDTIFNNWLEGLMALSRPGLETALPQVMRTAAWHDRKLEAVLASWAELRHDTILIVEQSTGGIGCQYPKGYVEPVPALYRALDRAAELMAQVYAGGAFSVNNVGTCMDHWRATLKTLAELADKEIAGTPMSAADLDFLNKTADLHGQSYYGERMFDGWYPQLFWTPMWQPTTGTDDGTRSFDEHPSGIAEPLVADVHTDAENGRALEVATGNPGLMIVAIDNQGDIALYGGPASSYYSFDVALDARMTDEEWQAKVQANTLPPRPAFAQHYWK